MAWPLFYKSSRLDQIYREAFLVCKVICAMRLRVKMNSSASDVEDSSAISYCNRRDTHWR
jgi:hypothetical protein